MPTARKRLGFTLIELMIVVAIIGIVSIIAIPNYHRFQLKSKSSEGKVNLGALRTAEIAYHAEHGVYLAAAASPTAIPGTARTAFTTAADGGFSTLGWAPEGGVYFSYGVAVTTDGAGFTADAGADIDGDKVNQYWTYLRENIDGERAESVIGCEVGAVNPGHVMPCLPEMGQSTF